MPERLEVHDVAEFPDSHLLSHRHRQDDRFNASEWGQRDFAYERTFQFGQGRVGADQLDRVAALGADRVGAHFEQGRGNLHAGQMPRFGHQPFRQPVRVARGQLQLGGPHDPAVELPHGARKAGTRDLRSEQQAHARGDPHDRKALLQSPRAQAHTVQVQHVCESHRGLRELIPFARRM